MHPKRLTILAALVLMVAFAAIPMAADAAVVKNLSGHKLGPGKYTYKLARLPEATRYRVEVHNGAAKGKERVSSAVVAFGPTIVFSQKDFNQNVTELEAYLSPTEYGTGLLTVEIKGKPGSYLEIKVYALVPDTSRPEYYRDYDLDTYGNPATRIVLSPGAPPPTGPPPGSPGYFMWVTRGGDCNDRDPSLFPGNGCPPLR